MRPPRQQDVRCQESCSSVRGQFSVHYSPRLRLARLFQSILSQYGSDYQSVFTRLYFLGRVFTFLSVSDLPEHSMEEEGSSEN